MKRRRRPGHWPVNWAVVLVAAVLTLGIGIVVAVLSSGGQPGGIVVPTPSAPPVYLTPSPT